MIDGTIPFSKIIATFASKGSGHNQDVAGRWPGGISYQLPFAATPRLGPSNPRSFAMDVSLVDKCGNLQPMYKWGYYRMPAAGGDMLRLIRAAIT
jgi:hypothetical protein